ncbi:SpoIIE family protein phosphatase [Nocardiopsis sp. CT-R113]|uniref:SpoIIE family protein phosphatase n=1 Tax=Nocardiopsis codii TaxID=3065942 RepID=A0ABU7KFS0_9ACTN|nr:GAF domain-containing SpoIIE family protein phosphatase [Nocardiopsis sp. CT-R113]MEE2041081.1 SpoIIE family protein phosphatase [Nocardiopsis sp. CT-R113]
MTEPLLRFRVGTVVDVALARAALARVLEPAEASDEDVLQFLEGAAAHALSEVEGHGTAEVVVERAEDGTALRATVADGSGATLWSASIGLSGSSPPVGAVPPGREVEVLSAEFLRTSGRAGAVAALAAERSRELEWHQRELEDTNQGVLALHAELAEASDEQQRLLVAEREARDEAEAARNRLTFLSAAGARLMTSLTRTEILATLHGLLIPRHADGVRMWLSGEDGNLGGPDAHGVPVSPTALLASARRRPVDDSAGRGELALPLLAGSELLGVLELSREGPVYPDDEVVLVELSRRVAASLDNARRFERERDTATALQRAMLTELPATPAMDLTARYLPATRGMNVGGDWYDVFPTPDGEFIGVVGDVTGHGIHAAVMMGQLRTALRAYALEERSPAVLLGRLHRFLDHLEPDLFATAVIVRFRPGDSAVVMAGAGHPSPLRRDGAGAVRTVDLGSGGMLGLPVDLTFTDHAVELPPGTALLLYTDGLVERRGELIDDGIGRLAESFGGSPHWPSAPEVGADELLDTMLDHEDCDDDVCLLVFLAPDADGGPDAGPPG